jgi:acetylornithine deacetylase/succinyl-diaminopimelate desuccinylase-like protein
MNEAKRLIGFNTVTSLSNADCALYVGRLLTRLGMEVTYQEVRQNGTLFLNVVGILGEGEDPLLLATHLDTVDPGDPKLWTQTGGNPWRLTLRNGVWYGLGVADTKLDLVCKLMALERWKGEPFKRPVMVLGTFGEESGLRGAVRFCQGKLPKPAMALVGEPTELAIVNRHKGLAVLELVLKSRGIYRPSRPKWCYDLRFVGRAAHSSTPACGVNAIEASLQFFDRCRAQAKTVKVLAWEGGNGHNVIPAQCRLRLSLEGPKPMWIQREMKRWGDCRLYRLPAGWHTTLPWQNLLQCLEDVHAVLDSMQRKNDSAFVPPQLTWNVTQLKQTAHGWILTMDIRTLPGQWGQLALQRLEERWQERMGPPGSKWEWRLERDNPALALESSHPWVKVAKAALKGARLPVRLAAKAGCSEAGLYTQVGIPSLVFGPGRSVGNIHRPNESVSIRQIQQAARFYAEVIRRTCF